MSILLLNGDCLQVMKDLSGASIDCFICDLPYGCLTGGGGKEKAKRREAGSADTIAGCSWDVKINLSKFWEQVKRLAKSDNSPVIMFCTTKFGAELIASNPSWFRYDLVWDKGRGVSFLAANRMPMRSHEMIYIFSKAGAYYRRVDVKGNFKGWSSSSDTKKHSVIFASKSGMPNGWKSNGNDGTTRCVKSVIQVAGEVGRNQHPTEKPLSLYKWLLERYCPPGGTILDPTAGSFNSCFAAYDLNLHAIGIEKDETFYKKASDRASFGQN